MELCAPCPRCDCAVPARSRRDGSNAPVAVRCTFHALRRDSAEFGRSRRLDAVVGERRQTTGAQL
jgi:hypothetical protein